MAVTLRIISLNLVNLRCRKRSVAEFMHESIVFLVRVQCRRKESSRLPSHLLMSLLYSYLIEIWHANICLLSKTNAVSETEFGSTFQTLRPPS